MDKNNSGLDHAVRQFHKFYDPCRPEINFYNPNQPQLNFYNPNQPDLNFYNPQRV
ncbi:hypothetical protein HYU07_02705 [Candidatus Woesearchaeota archaeon]|nr:hypothetical protein [Candidatus Woesearchaeota archaeon]